MHLHCFSLGYFARKRKDQSAETIEGDLKGLAQDIDHSGYDSVIVYFAGKTAPTFELDNGEIEPPCEPEL